MIDKKQKIRRLKIRLYKCMMDMPVNEMSSFDILLFNNLSATVQGEDGI